MKKALAILLLLVFAAPGCATNAGNVRYGRALSRESAPKADPRKVEKEANATLKAIVLAWVQADAKQLAPWDPGGLIKLQDNGETRKTSLDLVEEAIWIGKDTVMIRTSWTKNANDVTGSGATRHIANFIFTAASPLTLIAIEGENPF